MAVGFELLLGGVPPFFECRGFEDFGDEGGGDLCDGGFASVVTQNGTSEADGIVFGLGLDGFGICGFAGEDVGVGDGLKMLGGVGGLHGMAFASGKINADLSCDEAPIGDLAESPAFVEAIGSGSEVLKCFCCCRGKGSCVDGLLEFVCHYVLSP